MLDPWNAPIAGSTANFGADSGATDQHLAPIRPLKNVRFPPRSDHSTIGNPRRQGQHQHSQPAPFRSDGAWRDGCCHFLKGRVHPAKTLCLRGGSNAASFHSAGTLNTALVDECFQLSPKGGASCKSDHHHSVPLPFPFPPWCHQLIGAL